jgi:hypothetical protein
MRFRRHVSVIAALSVLAATTLQFFALIPAQAHGGLVALSHHKIQTPPTVKAVPMNNVKDFGAAGDGVTDDTAAIQNASSNASATGKGVFFPPGTYLHYSSLTFNGIQVTGSGTSSYLNAGTNGNCAVVLTGQNVSLSNVLISTASLTGGSSISNSLSVGVLIQYASPFTLSNVVLVNGPNCFGVWVIQSAVGLINGVVFNGTGNNSDVGVLLAQASNVIISNNLFQNEAYCVYSLLKGPSQFIAVVSNTMGNVTYPIKTIAISASAITDLKITQNTIQMATISMVYAIELGLCDLCTVQGNNLYGGLYGMAIASGGPGGTVVTQNTIHYCGGAAIVCGNVASTTIQIVSNTFGECGLVSGNPVIYIGGISADASAYTTYVANNSYQGHTNLLPSYVACSFTAPHLPATQVTGNTQTQTTLPNSF